MVYYSLPVGIVSKKTSEKLTVLFISSTPASQLSSGYHTVKGGQSSVFEKLSTIYNVKSFGWTKRHELPISSKCVYLFDGFQIFLNLLSCLLNGRFNVIVTTGLPVLESIPAFILGKLLRIPIVIKETHWYWPNTLISKFTWPVNKLMVTHSDLVICPGKRAYRYWQSIGIPERKIRIVHYYTSILQINPQITIYANELRSKTENKMVVLYFGRLIKKKGVNYLIRAFEKLNKDYSNVFLVIAGDGPERYSLKKLCDDLQLQDVLFTGAPSEKMKSAFFLISDIYTYPSVTLELPEEWPLGIVEAMSVGKPVIATTAVGSAPDVVHNGLNGYIVPEKDVDALYCAMKRIIADKVLRKNMSIESKKIIQKDYTSDCVVKSLDNAIKTAIRNSYR